MMRIAPLLFALVACGCGLDDPLATGPPLSEALAAGDADRALALLEAQAETGDLQALAQLADARSRGYLIASPGTPAVHLPIETWPWEGPLATRRFERALADSVALGSESALFLLADRHLDRPRPQSPNVEAARAIYDRLVGEGARPVGLAYLAQRLGDEDAFLRHLADGAAAGDAQACTLHFWQTRAEYDVHSARGMAERIDRIGACQALDPVAEQPTEAYGRYEIEPLVAQHALGNAAAAVTLDSLRALGVFERHPHLLPLLDADA